MPAGPEQQALLARIEREKEALKNVEPIDEGFMPNIFDFFGNDEGSPFDPF